MTRRYALLCAVALLLAPRALPADEGAARLRVLEVIRIDGIQAHMPGTVEDTTEQPAPAPPPEPPPPQHRALLDLPDWAVEALLWGIVLLGLGAILWSLRGYLPGFQSQRFAPAPETPSASPRNERLEIAQDEADDLARQGRFVEAMHLLLLRALAELRRRLGIAFADSLTSREILKQSNLPGAAAAALAEIIHLVETTYFGREAAGPQDYEACRGRFENLRRALKGGNPA